MNEDEWLTYLLRGFIAGEGIGSTTARLILTDGKLIHFSHEPEFEKTFGDTSNILGCDSMSLGEQLEGSSCLHNVGNYSPNDTASHPKRLQS
jgi:hypothetical protein